MVSIEKKKIKHKMKKKIIIFGAHVNSHSLSKGKFLRTLDQKEQKKRSFFLFVVRQLLHLKLKWNPSIKSKISSYM